ncbi:hypothetical protein CCICO_02880 [Corynebacterium ciconiae DSM 44920]|uniref:hypothetical protein n=1 Tax=Corynebacterium ciconiae TaxID=227319 RepID=UPI0012EA4F2F|nr:hypothetical protein [Corynebacterium ciconiae]WKD60621.1 hypothetical protein CCICO_02880 [Corynebacterium ciconiae DSM 44920]
MSRTYDLKSIACMQAMVLLVVGDSLTPVAAEESGRGASTCQGAEVSRSDLSSDEISKEYTEFGKLSAISAEWTDFGRYSNKLGSSSALKDGRTIVSLAGFSEVDGVLLVREIDTNGQTLRYRALRIFNNNGELAVSSKVENKANKRSKREVRCIRWDNACLERAKKLTVHRGTANGCSGTHGRLTPVCSPPV